MKQIQKMNNHFVKKFNLKFFCLAVVAMAAINCGKKNQSTSADPGPTFELLSNNLKLESGSPAQISLRRDDATFGPEFMVQPNTTAGITASEKKLQCGAMPIIMSPRREAPDVTLFNFHINEAEFHGVSQLPLKSNCQLEVIVFNSIGSSWSRKFDFEIQFDRHQNLPIIQHYAHDGGQIPSKTDSFNFTFEAYEIQNVLSYPVHFIYKPTVKASGKLLYSFSTGGLAYSNKFVDFMVTHIKYTGNPVNLSGDSRTELSFTVNPGETVTIYGVFHVPESIPRTNRGNFQIVGIQIPISAAITGLAADTFPALGGYLSLQISRSFEFGDGDFKNPLYITPKFYQPAFGEGAMPNWPGGYTFFSPLN
jgi:hypothetical protein